MKSFVKTLREHRVAIFAIPLMVLYLGSRIYESQLDAAAVKKETLQRAVPTVAITHAKPVEAKDTITLPGTIRAWYTAPIFAQVPGYVKMWYKDYGDSAKEGDILAEINQPTLDAEYRQAQADLQAERAKYDLAVVAAKRYLALRKTNAASRQAILQRVQEMKAQKAMVEAAGQQVKNLEARMQFKTIRAPFDGVVIERNINVGDYISEEGNIRGTDKGNLFTVADVSMLRLFVNVPISFGPFLRSGLNADVRVPQFPHRHFTAKFLNVAKGFVESTRTAVTQFTIGNEDRALWPGSYAEVHLTVPAEQGFFMIPSTALVFQEKGTEVAIVTEDNRVHFKPITVSRILDNAIEVKEGISARDRIINNPSAALLEGDKVRIVTPAPGYNLVAEEAPASLKPSSK